MNSFTVYVDFVRCASSFDRCFDVPYVAVPMFEIIGRTGNCSPLVHPSCSLCSFAVPKNGPGLDAVRYIALFVGMPNLFF